MHSSLTEEHEDIRSAVAKLVAVEVVPIVEDAERHQADLRKVFKAFGAAGYLCVHFPAQWGGSGADLRTAAIIAEEVGKVSSGIGSSLMVHSTVATQGMLDLGTHEQKQKYLVPAIRGEKVAAFALTEPNVGSDARAVETRAVRVANGYRLTGTKLFISNGLIADFFTVVARMADGPAAGELGLFIVERGAAGFQVVRGIPTLGNKACQVAELAFQDCFVPNAQRLGDEGSGGWSALRRNLGYGRLIVAARGVGLAQAALDLSLGYVKLRRQFGKAVSEFQMTKSKLAGMRAELEAARLLTYNAAWLADKGSAYHMQASIAKLYSSETAVRLAGEAVQLLGAYGYSEEYPAARFLRDAKVLTIGEGTSEIQRLIIASELGC